MQLLRRPLYRQAFLDYLEYQYLGIKSFGLVGQVNKNKNGKGPFYFWVGNDLVEMLGQNRVSSKISNNKMLKSEIYF